MSDFYSQITAPIVNGVDPFGIDVHYDTDYERLKSEMGKLGSIDADLVEKLSTAILTERSKDVRVLAFLAYSMLRKNDFGRLADVFAALAVFCRDNFEQIYPRRQTAKAAALRWFSESRFSGQCDNITAVAVDANNLERLVDAISKLRSALDVKFSDSAPPLSILYKKAVEWKRAADLAAAAPAAPANATDAAARSAGGNQTPAQPANANNDEYQEILDYIRKIEAFIINLKQRTVV